MKTVPLSRYILLNALSHLNLFSKHPLTKVHKAEPHFIESTFPELCPVSQLQNPVRIQLVIFTSETCSIFLSSFFTKYIQLRFLRLLIVLL